MQRIYQDRDLSWVGFNGRVLAEAAKNTVPLLERIRFLSIYSSNLDEFYRVRMPVVRTLNIYPIVKDQIDQQQQEFGRIIHDSVLPELKDSGIHWIYGESIPGNLRDTVVDIFFNSILGFINKISINDDRHDFFAENNKLYQAILTEDKLGVERVDLINIPSEQLSRLHLIENEGKKYILFLEDIIKYNICYFYPDSEIKGIYNLKITRDAELKVASDFTGDITASLERQLEKRDLGFATRFLAEPGIPLRVLYSMIYKLNLSQASVVQGGIYHNLKDLSSFPLHDPILIYPLWPPVKSLPVPVGETFFDTITLKDEMIHVPYQSYDPVIRFFNEAATDQTVDEIYTTLYRVANNSKIVNALITAAKNGKKVLVMVELKARFDEANNIKWAKQMKNAGARIVYSSLDLKVHAKIALIKRHHEKQYLGLMATGNLNEITAKFYTDHILFTANQEMLLELRSLFEFLTKGKKKPSAEDQIDFRHLLVAQFNLHEAFLTLIDDQIDFARSGKPSKIIIKLNNLEERVLIDKLYDASMAGVQIQLIVRGICCLVPGVTGLSENITVKRIVDRYLEHGRIFIFEKDGNRKIYMGSADWMNRNIYSRIEVCFPIYSQVLKDSIMKLINFQLGDNEQKSIYENISGH